MTGADVRADDVLTSRAGWLDRQMRRIAGSWRLQLGPGAQDGPALARRDAWIALALFVALVLVYFRGTFHGAHDSRWFIPASMSLLREGNPDLDEYRALIPTGDYAVVERGGHVYNYFPDGVSILVAPLVLGADRGMAWFAGRDLQAELLRYNPWPLELLIASLLTSLSAVVVYLTARRFTAWPRATAATLLYALGTPAWSTASRGLWQHGPSMLLLAIALYLLLRGGDRPAWAALAALPLTLAYFIRPTNGIALVVLTGYVLFHHRRALLPYLALAAAVVVLFALYNERFYGAPLEPYFQPSRVKLSAEILPIVAANLVSPSRGLLVFSPFLALVPVGLVNRYRRGGLGILDLCLLAIVVLHLVAISSFPHWWAGESLGPRFWTDMSPLLIYLLLPTLAMVRVSRVTVRSTFSVLLALLATMAVLIHGRCALDGTIKEWHTLPIDLDRRPSRVWDWRDIQFLRGIQVMAYEPKRLPLPGYTRWLVPNQSDVVFGRAMALRGYQVFAEGQYARAPKIVLYWQAGEEIDMDYSVFVHLLDEQGEMVAQDDGAPGVERGYPPTRWRAGDMIWDPHEIDLPDDVPAGTYRLRLGVYDWATGERLLVSGRGEVRDDAIYLPGAVPVPDRLVAPTFYFPLVHQMHTVISQPLVAP